MSARERNCAQMVLVVLACTFVTHARASDLFNGDEPIVPCLGIVTKEQVVKPDGQFHAAMAWQLSWPTGALGSYPRPKIIAKVVPPEGEPPLKHERNYPPMLQPLSCWRVKEITGPDEQPAELPDAEEDFKATCTDNPAELQELAQESNKVRVDPRKQTINFMKIDMSMIPHSGSAYLGITARYALVLHKMTGAYRFVMPDGRPVFGKCTLPSEALPPVRSKK